MKAITLWKTSTLVLAGFCAFTAGNAILEAQAEPQPHMVSALKNLNDAKDQLEKATHDKGGHRAAAAKLTKDAIEQVKKGIEADNKKSVDERDAPVAE